MTLGYTNENDNEPVNFEHHLVAFRVSDNIDIYKKIIQPKFDATNN